jgi:hypothetical protein
MNTAKQLAGLIMESDLPARLQAEIERLRAALEPFGRNVGAKSLVEALGHITREDMERAKELTKPD